MYASALPEEKQIKRNTRWN